MKLRPPTADARGLGRGGSANGPRAAGVSRVDDMDVDTRSGNIKEG